jgi:hypothetical protein
VFVVPPSQQAHAKNENKEWDGYYNQPDTHDHHGWPEYRHRKHGRDQDGDAHGLAGAEDAHKPRKLPVFEQCSTNEAHCTAPSPIGLLVRQLSAPSPAWHALWWTIRFVRAKDYTELIEHIFE